MGLTPVANLDEHRDSSEMQLLADVPGWQYYNMYGKDPGLYMFEAGVGERLTDTPLEVLAKWQLHKHSADLGFEPGAGVLLRIHTNPVQEEYVDAALLCASSKSKSLGQFLQERGVRIFMRSKKTGTRAHLINAIGGASPELHQRIHTRQGWTEDFKMFVAGNETIPESYVEKGDYRKSPAFERVQGTVEDWKNTVGKAISSHPGHQWSAQLALAGILAPVVPLSKTAGGGFHLFGGSSQGKSTALRVAHSVTGDAHSSGRSSLYWRTTDNGLEIEARRYNHRLLAIDEIGQGNPFEIVDAAYMLAEGVGKKRTNQRLENLAPITFELLFISTGEVSFVQYVTEKTKQEPMSGQQIRFLDIEWAKEIAPLYSERDIYELQLDLECHRGAIGRAFIENIAAMSPAERGSLRKRHRAICDRLLGPEPDGKVWRVGQRFALCILATELAIEWGLFPADWEADWATKKVFNSWHKANGAIDEGMKSAIMLWEFINTAISNQRFHILRDKLDSNFAMHVSKSFDVAGFMFSKQPGSGGQRATDEVGSTVVRLLPKVFKQALSGTSMNQTKRFLKDEGVIVCKHDGRYQTRMQTVYGDETKSVTLATNQTTVIEIDMDCLTRLVRGDEASPKSTDRGMGEQKGWDFDN
jgi:uncharacterized protein (DUF927 family)